MITFENKYAHVGPIAVHAAATATETRALWTAPRACKVTGISITPDVASTGDDTNSTTVSILNAGSAGSGTTAIATLTLATGTNLVALDEYAITTTTTALSAGDVLAIKFTKVGSGVLVGPLVAKISWYPTA